MYLKRIELHGFKSFADKVNVEFQPGITGIVGPNGCGKSNISDAVRWVLGEQSVKSLRGSNMADVIFAGSEDRRAQNVAEVTLVFDNTDRTMKYDYNEVEITRRLYRQGNEAEYYINKQQCRLKDITELIMDTGLGRDSLSIISQGNISHFADNKPEDRRAIFEEAAGVSKYKKRKLESIRKLERTQDNLERIADIVYELEKQVNPLKRQKEKAEKYLDLKEKLKSVEVNVLVKEIHDTKIVLDELSGIIKELNEKQASLDADILLKQNANDEIKKEMYNLDRHIDQLQEQVYTAMSDVSRLEMAKVEIDQKRKYVLENTNNEDIALKLSHLKEMISEAIEEYNDRIDRFQQTEKDLNQMRNDQDEMQRTMSSLKDEITRLTSSIQRDKSRKDILQEQIESRSNYHAGVKAIMDLAHSNPGIVGVFGDLLEYDEKYDLAISVALGGAMQFVVTQDDIQARKAIKFLRDNRAGRATFLPVSIMEPRTLRQEHHLICQNSDGYLGVLSDYVTSEKQIDNVILNQLGNVILADTLQHASAISKATFTRYKVVTLDGDIINVGGSLTGGLLNRKNHSAMAQKRELEQLTVDIKNEEMNMIEKRDLLHKLENKSRDISQSLLQKQMSYAKLEVVIQNKKEEITLAKGEYETLSQQKTEFEDFSSGKTNNNLINELNNAVKKKEDLDEQLRSSRAIRMNYTNQNEQLDVELRDLRKGKDGIQAKLNEKAILAATKERDLNNYLNRLNEDYSMTYEFALETYHEEIDIENAKYQVATLRNEIHALGHVNVDAIEEYKEVSSRYESMNTQRLDLIAAQDKILKAINEMDEIMIERFSTTFEKINYEFNHVFRSLFGGGHAEIKYTDPDNILETGIDIDVQPPGKAVQNITLFSGGEKALIAISCLFAILRVKPVPMCILDEVEAALDIANVERFAKYLREFSTQTQFIVVTHREGTMEECDLLYGATMQQKGVTKLVSVKLEEAIGLSDNQA